MRATGDGSPKKPGRIRHGVDVVLDFIAGCVSPVIPVLLVHWRHDMGCLLYTSPSPRDYAASRMPSSA